MGRHVTPPPGAMPIYSQRSSPTGPRPAFEGYHFEGEALAYLRNHRGELSAVRKCDVVGPACWSLWEAVCQAADAAQVSPAAVAQRVAALLSREDPGSDDPGCPSSSGCPCPDPESAHGVPSSWPGRPSS